jgi:hypothetical protein
MPVAIEQHAEWISDCIAHIRAEGLDQIEPQSDAAAAWTETVNDVANATLLVTAETSWYLGANVPDEPRAFLAYAGGMARCREICADITAKSYEGFTLA